MRCPYCPAQIAYVGEEHGCLYPELEGNDPAGPEDFGGSDEGSHYMSSTQGFKALSENLNEKLHTARSRQKFRDEVDPAGPRFGVRRRITHTLKTWRPQFEALLDGRKTFELRRNDRDFQVDDLLVLCEWDVTTEEYTGRRTRCYITYVTDGKQFGALTKGYVCLGLRPVDRKLALSNAQADKALDEFREKTKDAELYPGLTRSAFEAGRRFSAAQDTRSRPDDLRERGWSVVAHHDSCRDGNLRTTWFFRKGDCVVQGRGETDAEALDEVRQTIEAREKS